MKPKKCQGKIFHLASVCHMPACVLPALTRPTGMHDYNYF